LEIQFKRHKSKQSSKKGENVSFNDLIKLKSILFFKICNQLELELYLACCAWVYFEYLIKKGIVNKKNMSLYLSVLFFLTLKFYDIDDVKYINNFYELSNKCFKGDINKKLILENEMKVFGNLNFALVIPFEVADQHMDFATKNKKRSKNDEFY